MGLWTRAARLGICVCKVLHTHTPALWPQAQHTDISAKLGASVSQPLVWKC